MECQQQAGDKVVAPKGGQSAPSPLRTVCLVIPTKNEERTIASVLSSAKAILSEIPSLSLSMIVVVDDSDDGTRDIALAAGCAVVPGDGDGLGAAMLKGIREALRFQPEAIVSLDSDGQVELAELPAFLAPVLDGSADLVLGSRFQRDGLIRYRYPWINRFGVFLLCWILRVVTGQKVTDSHGGIRAMTSRVARDLEILGTHTYVQEAIMDASIRGYRIREIPSVWLPREEGQSRVVRSIPKYVIYTLPVILARKGLHLWLFYGMSVGFLVLGALDLARPSGGLFRASCHLFFSLSSLFFGFAVELLIRLRMDVLRRGSATA